MLGRVTGLTTPLKSANEFESASTLPRDTAKVPLAGISVEELNRILQQFGLNAAQSKLRAKQLRRWVHHFGVLDFGGMTDIAKGLRQEFSNWFSLERPDIVNHQVSQDGTQKWLIGFDKNVEGESVFIPDVAKSGALCVSSQVGCTLNCTFCHTGTQRLVRNLTAREIVSQVLIARDALKEWPSSNEDRKLTNIVFMGMGEPLYNLDNVSEAIDTISDGDGIAIGRRRITVSTAGIASKIQELGQRTGAMLAISLHAVRDDLRNVLVPINRKFDLKTLFEAIRSYPGLGNSRRVTFEYVMLNGVNDSLAEAKDLVRLLAGIPSKINLIPFNPWPNAPYTCSTPETIEGFAEILRRAGYASPIRKPRGRDILAACGQLRSESVMPSAATRHKSVV